MTLALPGLEPDALASRPRSAREAIERPATAAELAETSRRVRAAAVLGKKPAETVSVYRCQLVLERTIAVPSLRAASSNRAAEVVQRYVADADREHFVVLLLDFSSRILGINTVAIGTHAAVTVSPREVLKAPILHNADRIVVAHNHTNGDVRPSKQDRELTRDLCRIAKDLYIELVDHIIVGRGRYFSFAEHDLMPTRRRPRSHAAIRKR